MHPIERRYISNPALPVRVETREDGKRVIVGYASVFYRADNPGTEYELWPGVLERIGLGAFDRAIKDRHDARGLFNHDPSLLLGRVGAGTVRLAVDATGLRYEIDPPDTQVGRDVLVSLERGDLTGSSFAFQVRGDEWQHGKGGAPDIRTILDVDLLDVSPVTYPAYEATSTGLRSCDGIEAARAEHAKAKAAHLAKMAEVDAMRRDAELMRM